MQLNTKFGTGKKLVLSAVIIFELLALALVATYAWVETISSIKIYNNYGGIVTDYLFTDATIGTGEGSIDLAAFFRESGNMHFAPASSANGKDLYFPITSKTGSGTNTFRKCNISDKNVNYISFSFRVSATRDTDYFFQQAPTLTAHSSEFRCSITVADDSGNDVTTIYGSSASNNQVVNGRVASETAAQKVNAFSASIKTGTNPVALFSTKKNVAKTVTINMWIQSTDTTSTISDSISLTNFSIVSELSPRIITFVPTNQWNADNPHYYAWMWDREVVNGQNVDTHTTIYPMKDNGDGSYSFLYDGIHSNLSFIRANKVLATEITENPSINWETDVWNQTVDETIPNAPRNPYYFITAIGEQGQKSTGYWVPESPAEVKTIKIDYANGCTSDCGTISMTSYGKANPKGAVTRGTATVSSTAVANTGYVFDGWYENAEGTGTAIQNITTTPAAGETKSYYAKFTKLRHVKLYSYLNGTQTANIGTLTMTSGTTTASGNGAVVDKEFRVGSTVTLSATAASGYKLDGIYTTATGVTTANSVTVQDGSGPIERFARFSLRSYTVTAHAVTGTTSDSDTGGTVAVGSSDAGATSDETVNYTSSVTLTAQSKSGYEFVGWYSAATGGTKLSSEASYSYTLNTAGAVDVYARFYVQNWSISYGASGAQNWNSETMTVSGNTVTGSLTLTEGQDFSFKICKTVGSSTTWYGSSNSGTSYSNITSTTFISNLTLTSNNGGNDIYMKGHAGTYTFSFNKSTKVLNVTASYSTITITFDYSAETWVGNNNAAIWFYGDSVADTKMNGTSTSRTLDVLSTRGNSGSVGFNRTSQNNEFWNNFDAGTRGYKTTYKVGTGWQ